MGYLREAQSQAIEGTISLTVSESENLNGNGETPRANVQLELRQPPSLKTDYLKKDIASLDAATYVARRRMFEVNGDPLVHWKRHHFERKRDDTYRVVYEPKIGGKFFQKALRDEDYAITRRLTTSLEQPYFSKYNRFFPTKGHFCCKGCGNPLYSSEAKFDVDDGWPAFGACILGSIGVITVEQRLAQIEKKEKACIKIQAFVRGYQGRYRVEHMLDELIEELLRRKYIRAMEESNDDWSTQDGHVSSDLSADTSFYSWSSNSDEIDSSEKSGTDDIDVSRKSKGSNSGYVMSRDFGDDYAEIHCHRCKSHLGDVFVQENVGTNGTKYRERHRVNGRAIKYMDVDLPKTINAESSLLFADASYRRRFRLPNTEEDGESSLPFGTLHWMHMAPNCLSVSNHEHTSHSDIQRKPFDELSQSCHIWSRTGRRLREPSIKAIAKLEAFAKRTDTKSRLRPMMRGSTKTSINIAKRAAMLENEFLTSYPSSAIE